MKSEKMQKVIGFERVQPDLITAAAFDLEGQFEGENIFGIRGADCLPFILAGIKGGCDMIADQTIRQWKQCGVIQQDSYRDAVRTLGKGSGGFGADGHAPESVAADQIGNDRQQQHHDQKEDKKSRPVKSRQENESDHQQDIGDHFRDQCGFFQRGSFLHSVLIMVC